MRATHLIVTITFVLMSYVSVQAKTVLDYYCLIPDEFFQCEDDVKITRNYKLNQIKYKNIKAGYIRAESERNPMEVALFKDIKSNKDVVAVNIKCGPGCMCNRFALLQFDANGKAINITASIFPNENLIWKKIKRTDVDAYEFILPEVGTTIKVVHADTGEELAQIFWRDGKFVLQQKNK